MCDYCNKNQGEIIIKNPDSIINEEYEMLNVCKSCYKTINNKKKEH